MKEPLLISACLLGLACRYDGRSVPLDAAALDKLKERWSLVPVCPEQLGGLPTPRPPAERKCGGVFTGSGTDVTAQYARGAGESVRLAAFFGCKTALLKAHSPSCGSGEIYDGTFSHTLVPGDGICASLLKANGIAVLSELDIERIRTYVEKNT